MQLPHYTKSQKIIINHLYKFRFLTIDLFQKLFNHKDPKRIKEWLKDLNSNKYIDIVKDPKSITKPYIFCLAQKAGQVLKLEENINLKFLNWLYKEKDKDERFIQRHLFVARAYVYFQKNKDTKSEVNFFTKQDLYGYEYFPDPLPDAYIDVNESGEHSRYFLDYFDDNTPVGISRYRVRYYLKYFQNGTWQANTDKAKFPSVLVVCPSEKRVNHIGFYAKAVLAKSCNTEIEIFLTAKDNIKFAAENVNIWRRVE